MKNLIHGLGQNATSWDAFKAHVTADVVCVDLMQPRECPLDYTVLYDTLKQVCRSYETVELVGVSLGAVLALQYAIDFPDKVRSIVLINGQYKMPKMALALQNNIFRCLPNRIFTKMGVTKKDFIQITNSMKNIDFTQELAGMTIPTLVVSSQKDKVNRSAAQQMANVIPTATLSVLADAGHEANRDNPSALAKIIERFWQF